MSRPVARGGRVSRGPVGPLAPCSPRDRPVPASPTEGRRWRIAGRAKSFRHCTKPVPCDRGTHPAPASGMGQLWTELRYAFRVLVRNGSSSVLAILCLGLGIGLQATIFAAADPWLFRPLPYAQPDRLAALREIDPKGSWHPGLDIQLLRLERAGRGFQRPRRLPALRLQPQHRRRAGTHRRRADHRLALPAPGSEAGPGQNVHDRGGSTRRTCRVPDQP